MAMAAQDTTNDTFLNRLDIMSFFLTKKGLVIRRICIHMVEDTRKH